MSIRSVLAGSLALIVLEILVTSRQATGRVSGLFSGVAKAVDWLVDPNTPGIPDRTVAAAASRASTTSATTSASSPQPSPTRNPVGSTVLA